MNLEEIKRVGLAAAFKAAEVLRFHLGKLTDVKKKGAIDLVTEADTESEAVIVDIIKKSFPDHSILAEESGRHKGSAENLWIIDPLDGTTNYAHQLSLFAISIAFSTNGQINTGIVLNPATGELFTAQRGQGSMLNGKPVTVSESDLVSESLLVTGFPYNFNEDLESIIARFTRCLSASRGIRRLGSAALDLCFVACGRFAGFWEQDLKPWDTAAGMLIALEAGAKITDFSNQMFSIYNNEILATNGKIHGEMLSLLDIKEKI